MAQWNVHGWDHLTSSDPGVVAHREELLQWLQDVPERQRTDWEKRLKGKLDHPHFSVRLELYLHHFFKERGWKLDIEPDWPGTRNKPDFFLKRDGYEMSVEAKTLLGPEDVEQQDTRLMALVDELSKRLNRTVLIHPYSDLPPSLPNRRIAAEIEQKASESESLLEFRVGGEHQGYQYNLEVTVLLDDELIPSEGVGAIMTQAHHANTGQRMREEIVKKANKYGKVDIPFVITVWPQTWLYDKSESRDDYIALKGDLEWAISPFGQFEESHKLNGVFSEQRRDGAYRYSHVSAVAIYRFSWDLNPPHNGDSLLRIYHNPYTERPVDQDVFQGVPQDIVHIDTRELETM